MSEDDERGFSFEELTGSDWWVRQITDPPNWAPGGVFLVCTGPAPSIAPVGAWFYVASGLATSERKPAFPEILLVVPPGTKQLNYRDRIKDALRHSFEKAGKQMPENMARYVNAADWPLVQSDAGQIVTRLESLPEQSAVSIVGAQRLRFPNLERRTGPAALTHTGQRLSHSSQDDLLQPHLHELLRRLLQIATNRSLSIVVFFENFDFGLSKLPDDLRTHRALAVSSVGYAEAARSRYLACIEALKISRAEGLEAGIEYARQNILDAAYQAHAIGFLYGDQGLWTEAWKIVEPHVDALRGLEEASVLLNLAQTAAGCGEASMASELLREAFALGFEAVESFNAAATVAQSSNSAALLDEILAEMRVAYPYHPMTVARSFGRLIATARYREAAEMADAVGSTFEAAWARFLEQDVPDWGAFLTIGRQTQHELEALSKCIRRALDIGQSQRAREFFQRVPENRETAALRAELLFSILVKEVAFADDNEHLEQLRADCSSVLGYLAANPSDSSLRTGVSQWFQSCSDKRSRIVLLLSSLTTAYKKSRRLFDEANATNESSPWSFTDVDENGKKATAFMQAVAESSGGRPFGQAVLPPNYAEGVPDSVMRGLGILVHAFTEEPDLKGIGNVLQCLNLACRIRHEPSWDSEAAIQLAGALASHGKVSDGLNLAENLLIFWGDGGGEFGAARRAHSWSCLAEVYLHARNPLASLVHVVLCFESMAAYPAPQHATLLKHKLRLATRTLRDLQLCGYVREFLDAEARLIRAFPRDREEKEWNVTEIGCRLRLVNEATTQEGVEALIRDILATLEDEDETEWGPPVSSAVSALSILRAYGYQVPESLVEGVRRRLPLCSLAIQRLFGYFLLERPSATQLRAAVRDLLEGNAYDDEGFAISAMEGLFRRAIKNACDMGDPELFALAASWLSQPALAASRISRQASINKPRAELASLSEIAQLGNPISPQQMLDYAVAVQRQAEQAQSPLLNLPELPISAAKYVVGPAEALCLLAQGTSGRLCRLIVRRAGLEGPSCVAENLWKEEEYQVWAKKYPREYSWDRHYGAFGPYDTPDEAEIRQSLTLLQPELPFDAKTITILPEADLFGFSYWLTNGPSGWAGDTSVCVAAPSLPWLAAVRQLPNPHLSLNGWLGHPTSADSAILRPRGELKPLFASFGGTLLESATPQNIGASGVTVILAHGSQGTFGSFVGVDDVGQFTVEEMALWLRNSACVILFVCNAGRNDHRVLNQETFGLVGQLLRRNVRAVVAPPAPLRNDLPALWFPAFYESLQKGKTVGQSYAEASEQIRRSFPHPCAWGALQLFGDAQLAFVK